MINYIPENVLVLNEPVVANSIVTGNILKKLENLNIPVSYLSHDEIADYTNMVLNRENPFREGKKTLLITKNPGEFLKKCPGTNDYICCNYYVIDFAQNCPMDCTYCILQAYLNNPLMIVYANINDLFNELSERIEKELKPAGSQSMRIGTGEFTDSMALEHLTGYSELLIDFFEKYPDVLIEFKSKTDYIETFLKCKTVPGNVLLSWSMNAQNVNRDEEHKSASIVERLVSAKKCADMGYKITLHFDPIIDYENFDSEMAETVNLIFSYLRPASIKYISLGCFRYIPKLKEIVAERFPKSKIVYNEFVKGYDGKSRYFRYKRERLFSKIISLIKKYDVNNEIELYFCMESPEMWKKLLNRPPDCDEKLGSCLYFKCFNKR
ncbi:MAG: hypothetical protein QMC67_11495 [Candidatus Wallbacteria bacterium]